MGPDRERTVAGAAWRTALPLFSQEPVGDTFHIDSHTEELVNMLLVVIVLSSDAADGDTVAFGGGIEP